MSVRAFVTRFFLVLVAFFFALGLQAYLFVQQYLHKPASAPNKLSKADSCKESAPTVAVQDNSNKLLFISCGGFEE